MSEHLTEARRQEVWGRKPYDPTMRCPKCVNDAVTSKWVTFEYLGLPPAVRRRCLRCDYTTDQAPVDTLDQEDA